MITTLKNKKNSKKSEQEIIDDMVASLKDKYGEEILIASNHLLSKFDHNLSTKRRKLQKFSSFVNNVDKYVKKQYLYAIKNLECVEALTKENVLEFINDLGNECAEGYLVAIINTKEFDLLTNEKITTKRISDFVKNFRVNQSAKYFYSIGITGDIDRFTNEKIINFGRKLNQNIVGEYFYLLANDKNVDRLTDEKLINSEVTNILKHVWSFSYFEIISYINNPELFIGRGSVAISIEKGDLFKSLIKDYGIIKSAIEYYGLLSKTLKNITHIEEIGVLYDDNFCKTALKYLDKGSATKKVYNVAYVMYNLHKNNYLNVNFDEVFSQGPDEIEKYFHKITDQVFTKHNLIDFENLRDNETQILIRNIYYIKKYSDMINKFITRRISKDMPKSPFNSQVIKPGVILEKKLENINIFEIDSKTALESMVYLLNGSREIDKVNKAKRLVLENGYFKREDIDSAFGSWASIKKLYQKELAQKFSVYLKEPTIKNAEDVINVFKNAATGKNIKLRDNLYDFIGKLEPLIMGDLEKLSNGKRLVAYNCNKDNVLEISGSETGACCFMDKANEKAALQYAIDNNVVLINFTISDSSKSLEALKKEKVYGIAICVFAETEDGKKVLVLDSFEGGVTINNALKNDFSFIEDVLKRFAKDTGCEAVLVNNTVINKTPRKFVNYLRNELEIHNLRLFSEKDQYLEIRPVNARVRVLNLDTINNELREILVVKRN